MTHRRRGCFGVENNFTSLMGIELGFLGRLASSLATIPTTLFCLNVYVIRFNSNFNFSRGHPVVL